MILSHYQAFYLLSLRSSGSRSGEVSPDLGLTKTGVTLTEDGAEIDGQHLTWEAVAKIEEAKTTCFTIEGGKAEKVQLFSQHTNRFYSLFPTRHRR